jgi:acetylornithine deacetylase/succinyl-diaminopimelate desuccinylase-like protein
MNTKALDDLLAFLRHPSVSTDPAFNSKTAACADWLVEYLRAGGLNTELHSTPGHPVIVASTPRREDRKTILIYGHYDVQPVDPLELWHSDPFDPTVKDGVITARGATDNKGQIMAHIQGVLDVMAEEGEPPVNVVFLIEGEEEIGSENLLPFLKEHSALLASDIALISDTSMVDRGVPTLTYGLRGIAAMEVRLRGPQMDLHSGMFGGTIMNPATAAARMAASLHNHQERVTIPGFYDAVIPLADWEREMWSRLPLDEDALKRITGVSRLVGEQGYSGTERIAGRPTAEINGIGGGYQGAGSKTVIPSESFIKITFRLVPEQDPAAILSAAEDHLRKVAPPGIEVTIEKGHSAMAYLTDPHSGHGLTAQQSLQEVWGVPAALVREGGSIPIVQSFKQILGVETLLLGLALPDCGAHSPNETFPVENYEKGILLNRVLLRKIAQS